MKKIQLVPFWNELPMTAKTIKQNMGLTTWKNAPYGQIRKTDVSVAKNYLNEEELNGLNRIVSMYLDYAEMQANNRKVEGIITSCGKL